MATVDAWLIEHVEGADVTYYCGPGDWCGNPNHAYKFVDREEAERIMKPMQCIAGSFRVAEHQWSSPDA